MSSVQCMLEETDAGRVPCLMHHIGVLTLPARLQSERMTLVISQVTVHTPAISTAVRATSSKLLIAAAETLAASSKTEAPSPDTSGTRNVPTGCVAITRSLDTHLVHWLENSQGAH